MKAIIQRIANARVDVDGQTVGSAEKGFMILLGVGNTDTDEEAKLLATKTANLRIFEDGEGKMNLSLLDISGEALVVSNFTLCADTKKGNRPSFINAMAPIEANRLYELYCDLLCSNGVKRVEKGVFGADMQVHLVNDGPVTITLDTDTWRK